MSAVTVRLSRTDIQANSFVSSDSHKILVRLGNSEHIVQISAAAAAAAAAVVVVVVVVI
jgi:hypothetical protein